MDDKNDVSPEQAPARLEMNVNQVPGNPGSAITGGTAKQYFVFINKF
jgi:hypothetical protein